MGVPKFFRYISERYPCLSEVVKEYQIPEFDNLYLDMNGIIHNCSHPDDFDPHFRISEETIFANIFHYIEVLFRMIQPRKLFFMAIDGVAPRAKMNQQRGRRFRSAKDAEVLEATAKTKGELLPTEARFDSNCITPGTEFMAKLHEQLKYFVVNKISTDKLWQNCRILLSGHETPGEGEHKIMDYIRFLRAQPGYDPNTRHCLYGLDADLIMLGLCTHEPHFSLLREEVKFSKKAKRKTIPEEITFYLLHLSLMREYLELEFIGLIDKLPFVYDMEKIIDDWVLMGFLVGNDFIPHLPNLHIQNGALPILYKAYMEVLPTMTGYINEAGKLNLQRFGKFMSALGSIDVNAFEENYADLKYFESKTGRKMDNFQLKNVEMNSDECMDAVELLQGIQPTKIMNSDLAALIESTQDLLADPGTCSRDTGSCEEDLFRAEFKQHKTDYYMNKLDYEKVTPEVLRVQAEGYVRAIQWNLHYYYNGCCSWSWYYPHHYAPYISDIKDFDNLKIEFDLGTPFLPFQQLLAVLPAASKNLLPEPYQTLMTSKESPIVNYYPEDFQTDLNGKRQEWEAVVLIPFIAENELLNAMLPFENDLSQDEKKRNSHGPMLMYEYSIVSKGIYKAPQYFPEVSDAYIDTKLIYPSEILIEPSKLIKGAYPGVKFDVYFPGFPTMKHLKYSGFLEKAKVRVFDQPSRGENMILQIQKTREDQPIQKIAEELLGNVIYVGWPHLIEAKVFCVSNNKFRYHFVNGDDEKKISVEDNKGNLASMWMSSRRGITDHHMTRLGIDVGKIDIVVHASSMVGRKYVFGHAGKFSVEKIWAEIPSTYALQATVQDIAVHVSEFVHYKDVREIFPVDSKCFMLGHPHYGSEGVVVDSTESLNAGRIKLTLSVYPEPDLTSVIQRERDLSVQYLPGAVAAQRLAISPFLLSRITGSIFIIAGMKVAQVPENASKTNIGLNLKFNKRNEEIPGYTRKDGTTWLYSVKAVQLVSSFMEYCPELFEYLASHTTNDLFFEGEVFPDNVGDDRVKEIAGWIKKQPYSSIDRQDCGSSVLDPEVITILEESIDNHLTNSNRLKSITMQVKPRLLFKPEMQFDSLAPDSKATYYLYDRVVNVRESYTVPVGYKGTVIGLHQRSVKNSVNNKGGTDADFLYDVLFDVPFVGGMVLNCSTNRGYKLPALALLNISHGIRMEQQKKSHPAINEQQSNATNTSAWRKVPSPQSQNSAFASWDQKKQGSNTNHNTTQKLNKKTHIPPNYEITDVNQINKSPKTTSSYTSASLPKEAGAPVRASTTKQTQKSTPTSGVSEFQAIWDELHHLGKHKNNPKAPPPPTSMETADLIDLTPLPDDIKNTEPLGANSLPAASTLENLLPTFFNTKSPVVHKIDNSPEITQQGTPQWSDDRTEMLKQILKIDEVEKETNANKPKLVNQTVSSVSSSIKTVPITQSISVQDLFARAKSSPVVSQLPPTPNYSVELLHNYQRCGLGIPRYNYLFNGSGSLVRAQVLLPSGQSIIGEAAPTREQASDLAAQLVLCEMKEKGIELMMPMQHAHLPSPPQQWCHRNWFGDQPRSNANFYPQFQHQTVRGTNSKPEFQHNPETPSTLQRGDAQGWPVGTQQGKSPFVPLQAVKQQRNKSVNNGLKNSPNSQKAKNFTLGTTPSLTNPHEGRASLSTGNVTTKQDETGNSEATKPVVKKIRKSRIAAKFGGV